VKKLPLVLLLALALAAGRGPAGADERQGQIVAGNHDGRRVTRPGYLQWLASRGLLPGPFPQTVALFDIGYDDGSGPEGNHHPDLENPERLVDAWNFVNNTPFVPDPRGHGTMVAGILSGEGTGTGEKDPQGFLLGAGIAPRTRLVAVKIFDRVPSSCDVIKSATRVEDLERALRFARTTTDGHDKALIANHSWAEAVTRYGELAQLFDRRTIDADPVRPGLQPMLMVFGAGNGGPGFDTVSSPAVAKNVIAVGSSQNFRPSVQPGAAPLDCFEPVPDQEDGRHIGRVNQTSGRGLHFGAKPDPAGVHNTRVKPDVVAPGGRVFSTVPYRTPETYTCPRSCRPFWPDPTVGFHSYVQATSYATPVVTGVAALTRQWFLARGVDPAPSLLKAALIATADDLGYATPADHRPSPVFGWGRVDLDRLTSTALRFFVNESEALALATGQERSWTRTVADPASEVAVVLAWSDPPAPVVPHSQASLLNDLALTVERADGTVLWRGNNFNENVTGVDDGYSHPFLSGEEGFRDAINTVEAVFLPPGTLRAGERLVIRVAGVNVTEGPQRFAVYAYNVRPRR
jgi:hypothetical protein